MGGYVIGVVAPDGSNQSNRFVERLGLREFDRDVYRGIPIASVGPQSAANRHGLQVSAAVTTDLIDGVVCVAAALDRIFQPGDDDAGSIALGTELFGAVERLPVDTPGLPALSNPRIHWTPFPTTRVKRFLRARVPTATTDERIEEVLANLPAAEHVLGECAEQWYLAHLFPDGAVVVVNTAIEDVAYVYREPWAQLAALEKYPLLSRAERVIRSPDWAAQLSPE